LNSTRGCSLAIKHSIGKLDLGRGDALADLRLRVLPYTAEHAYRLFGLPLHHSDPFDRQIIAQALAENTAAVTPMPSKMPSSSFIEGIKVIW
jgi:PIN domain nuclease of toxin-antitoxin system